MFLKRAMRYYRVWIYCCNIALLAATVVFVIFFLWFLTDVHMFLFPSVSIYHPSFLYAFLALILQGGVVQLIGCLGAIRMNEKLLNIYWNILVILLFGDAIVGVIWLFRYDVLVTNLKSDLKAKLNTEYGLVPAFHEVWDRIQVEFECCGVDNPFDYNSTAWRRDQQMTTENNDFPYCVVPHSCRRSSPVPVATSGDSPTAGAYQSAHLHDHRRQHHTHHHQHHHRDHRRRRQEHSVHHSSSLLTSSPLHAADLLCESSFDPKIIHVFGCYESILNWLQRATDILSVLGFCVITFLKVCFTCILRYEIREMIQKIQVLKGSSSITCTGHSPPAESMHDEATKNEDKI